MLVNTQRDTDIVSVSNRTEPEEEKESWTREKALERNKKQLQEKKEEAVTEYPDTVSSIHEKIMKQKDSDEKTENPMQTDFSGYAENPEKAIPERRRKRNRQMKYYVSMPKWSEP